MQICLIHKEDSSLKMGISVKRNKKNNKRTNKVTNKVTNKNIKNDRYNGSDEEDQNGRSSLFSRKKSTPKVATKDTIKNKLVVYMIITLLAFVVLFFRVFKIATEDGERYKKIVLGQQTYNSTTLPYKRGSIEDRNGITLAHSILVYNMILDCNELNKSSEKIEPTLMALNKVFGIDTSEIREYIRQNPSSAYHIVQKKLLYEEIKPYLDMVEDEANNICETGVWFEEGYKREYPNGSLAADVIGFTTKDDRGQYGLEEYYEDTLSGTNGRTYGYRTEDYGMEYNIIPAKNGKTLSTTLDSYIQQICEENIEKYNKEHAGEYREGDDGSDNTGVIVMDIDSGEVLAMASYPFYNLSNPYDISNYYSEADIEQMKADETYDQTLNSLWKNFCISQSYEPGSVGKTFTIGAALDNGSIHDGDVFYCNGYLTFGEGNHATTIRCHNRYGEGQLTVKGALEQSCNVCLIQMAEKVGAKTFLKYFSNFNLGLKTNIDLAGEMRTDSLVFNENTMGVTELATSSFGQGYNATMIQMISAYCSLINGGYLYQPHVVNKILDDNGSTVETISPVVLRQTVSEKTSELMRDYCIGVVENGTGKNARPAGYRIGGKTGTAEHSGAGKIDYVVSFMGFAPADDPQIAIYVVIDRPNTATQDTATRYACLLCKDILTDVLPYLNIYMTEELTDEEKEELEARNAKILSESKKSASENDASANEISENDVSNNDAEGDSSQETSGDEKTEDIGENDRIVIDPETGYAIDPLNGEFLDPETGQPINPESSIIEGYGGIQLNDTGLESNN